MSVDNGSANPPVPPGGGQVAGPDWVPGPDDEFLGYFESEIIVTLPPEEAAKLKPGRWVPVGRRGNPGPAAPPAPD
ncbi:MAG: hypothetical protein K2X87_03830, partial [Gemmataceae bacterium]|nr:hypothetical protein [Gemmataceae bacterium]